MMTDRDLDRMTSRLICDVRTRRERRERLRNMPGTVLWEIYRYLGDPRRRGTITIDSSRLLADAEGVLRARARDARKALNKSLRAARAFARDYENDELGIAFERAGADAFEASEHAGYVPDEEVVVYMSKATEPEAVKFQLADFDAWRAARGL